MPMADSDDPPKNHELMGQQRPMRRGYTSDDEKRLFPSFVRKDGGTPIVPGQTVAGAKRTKPGQQYSNKPVDRISQNTKQSGPIRSRGRESSAGKDLWTAIGNAASLLEHAPNVEASDRPAKRQRRNPQRAPSNVYDISDNDDVMEQTAPTSGTPPGPEPSSRPSSSRKQTGNGVRHPNEDTIPESVPSNSDHDELFTESAARRRRSFASDIMGSHSKGLDPASRPGILQSVEIQGPKVASGMIASPSVANRRRWSSTSTDELQGGVTVQPVPSSLPPRKKDVRSASDASCLRSSPSDIRSTTFSPSGSKSRRSRQKQRTAPSEQTHRLKEQVHRSFEASHVRVGPVHLRPSSEKAIEVHIDTTRFWVVGDASDSSFKHEVPLQKIIQITCGRDPSCKLRLVLSKAEGQSNQIDIELVTMEVKGELYNLLKGLPVKFQHKTSSRMDETFKKSERDIANYSNRLKRPSIDSISEPAPEPKTEMEMPKRAKISESPQVDNGPAAASKDADAAAVGAPANGRNEDPENDAHTHPPGMSASNSVEIPVKTYSPQVPPSNRQTRSTTHRAEPEPATVICDDDDDDDGHDLVPQPPARQFEKWEKPLLYPRFGKKKAEVDAQDRERLRFDEFLNDNLIGFYMRFLEDHLDRTNKDTAKRVYFFNSYFYATLTNNPKNKKAINYEGVQKWTRSVDIFSYDYIVVPINEAAHWYVAVICNLPNLQRISKGRLQADETASQEPPLQPESEVQTVLDTPMSNQEVAQGQEGSEEKTIYEPAKEEMARQSMAAMTLHDQRETNDKAAQEIPASDEDWPEKEENPTTSPIRFSSPPKTRSGAQQTSEDAPKATALSQKSRKSKKKSRGPRNARDARDLLDPIIITFDSLDLARSPTIRNLRQYLSEEAKSKKGVEIDTTLVGGLRARSIPLQSNYSDCGLYLLAYVEKFVQDPDRFVSKLLRGEMNGHTDWPPLSSGVLRQRLRTFLDELYDEQEQLSREEVGEKCVMADMRPISFLLGEWEPEQAVNAEEKPNTDTPQTRFSPQPEKATGPDSQPLYLPEPEKPEDKASEAKVSVIGPFQPLLSPGTPTRSQKHKASHVPEAVQSVFSKRAEQGAGGDIVDVPNSQEPEPGILNLTSPQKKTGNQPPVPQVEKKDTHAVTVDVAMQAVNPPAPSNGEREKEVQVHISGTPTPPPEETKSAKKKRERS